MRWSRPGLDAEVRALAGEAALGPHPTLPNLSVVLGEWSEGIRTKHQLHVQGQPASVTRHEGTLVRAIIRALGALACDIRDDTLSINAFVALDADGNANVIDRRLAADFRRVEPRLRRTGLRVVEVPWLMLRRETCTAILPDGAGVLGVPVDAVDERWPREGTDDDLAFGERHLTKIIYAGHRDPESLAAALGDMTPLLRDTTGRVKTSDVEMLAGLSGRTVVAGVPRQDLDGLAALLSG